MARLIAKRAGVKGLVNLNAQCANDVELSEGGQQMADPVGAKIGTRFGHMDHHSTESSKALQRVLRRRQCVGAERRELESLLE